MKDTFTPNGKAALEKILRCMKEADAAFATLTADENKACLDFHAEGASLNHCTRWGLRAAEELHAAAGPYKRKRDAANGSQRAGRGGKAEYSVVSVDAELNAGWAIRARDIGLKVSSGAPQRFGNCDYLVKDNRGNAVQFVQNPSGYRKLDVSHFNEAQMLIVMKLQQCGIVTATVGGQVGADHETARAA